MKTIRVIGKSNIKVKPDITIISLSLEKTFPEYEEALKNASNDTETIKNILFKFGFNRSDLKTLDFDIDTAYESYKEEDVHKKRLIGYKYIHEMKIEFDSNNDLLGKILYDLSHCDVNPELRLSYAVKDQESAKNKLLANAVKDAKEKANIMAIAAGATLKSISSIEYATFNPKFESRPFLTFFNTAKSAALRNQASYNLDIEPDEIEASDSVTIVWEIE